MILFYLSGKIEIIQTNNKNRHLNFLDGLRGLASLYVMLGHARFLLWEGYSEYLTHPELYGCVDTGMVYLFSIFRYGHEAVIFFFVLSGFVIHLKYSLRIKINSEAAKFDFLNYLYRRGRRIYPPLLLALLITLVLDSFGFQLGYEIYKGGTNYDLINLNKTHFFDLGTFLGHLGFTMSIYVPAWGSNGALWSLAYEWWFYMIYPILWFVSKRSILFATLLVGGFFIISFFLDGAIAIPFLKVFNFLPIWWMGSLTADIYNGRIQVKWQYLGFLALLLPIACFIKFSYYNVLNDLVWGIGFVGLIASFLYLQERNIKLTVLERLKSLGEMSYTLYVIHVPILVLISGYLMTKNPNGQLPDQLYTVILVAGPILIISYFLHLIVERPFTNRNGFTKFIFSKMLPWRKKNKS